MKILIANPGSTSYKCKLYDMAESTVLFQTIVERIGDKEGIYSYNFTQGENDKQNLEIPDYFSAVNLTLETLKERYAIEEVITTVEVIPMNAESLNES